MYVLKQREIYSDKAQNALELLILLCVLNLNDLMCFWFIS